MPECLVDKDGDVYHNKKADILSDNAPQGRYDKPKNVDDLVIIDLSVVMRTQEQGSSIRHFNLFLC